MTPLFPQEILSRVTSPHDGQTSRIPRRVGTSRREKKIKIRRNKVIYIMLSAANVNCLSETMLEIKSEYIYITMYINNMYITVCLYTFIYVNKFFILGLFNYNNFFIFYLLNICINIRNIS